MFGRELASGNMNTRGKTFYRLLGSDNIGQRIRALHVLKMLGFLDVRPKRILDAGAGDGSFCFTLSRRYREAHITGVELNPARVRNSRQILDRVNCGNVTIKNGDISSRSTEGVFDLVVCVDVLEHVPDDISALRYLYCSLEDGGVLLLHVPQRHQLNRGAVRSGVFAKKQADHVRDEYSEEEIMAKITAQGFVVIKKVYTFGFWAALAREMVDAAEKTSFFRPILKLAVFPLALFVSRADLFANNEKRHQGFLFALVKT